MDYKNISMDTVPTDQMVSDLCHNHKVHSHHAKTSVKHATAEAFFLATCIYGTAKCAIWYFTAEKHGANTLIAFGIAGLLFGVFLADSIRDAKQEKKNCRWIETYLQKHGRLYE